MRIGAGWPVVAMARAVRCESAAHGSICRTSAPRYTARATPAWINACAGASSPIGTGMPHRTIMMRPRNAHTMRCPTSASSAHAGPLRNGQCSPTASQALYHLQSTRLSRPTSVHAPTPEHASRLGHYPGTNSTNTECASGAARFIIMAQLLPPDVPARRRRRRGMLARQCMAWSSQHCCRRCCDDQACWTA